METTEVSCNLIHHGAAATSSSKVVICIPSPLEGEVKEESSSSEIVYASHALLNISRSTKIKIGESNEEPIWNVYRTLRTRTKGSSSTSANVATMTAKRVITCVAQLIRPGNSSKGGSEDVILVCGFSDGTITSWNRQGSTWKERVLVTNDNVGEYGRSITDIGGMVLDDDNLVVISCSSGGAVYYKFLKEDDSPVKEHTLVKTPANSLKFHNLQSGKTLVLIGTAAPRHNKIHVFLATPDVPHYCGSLTGHEDWITCFDWITSSSVDFLASGSQDAKIRLWKFETTATNNNAKSLDDYEDKVDDDDDNDDDDEQEDDGDLEDKKEEGEARLEIFHENLLTSVFLEALLIGHEERVTSVTWHPNPKPVYNQDLILISSSMDRTILIWSEHESGIWTPISRVGSAGGILGGSIGSSLLGFLNTTIEPNNGAWLLGHGYGGALHLFSCEQNNEEINTEMTIEERAALSPWRALPCVTGHFDGVTDLCWEADSGDYLVTVSHDHTCRVWASAPNNNKGEAWIEIARPQVHGYNLSAITSLSTSEYPHLLVSGADEKELRAFDATNAFIRLLKLTSRKTESSANQNVERVERAYIPSLGLSNKATAADGAEEDTGGASESSTRLPLERDLGAVSLWPEVRKLYGHTSELARLASTVQARTFDVCEEDSLNDLLVASSAKARDVDTACIRVWDVKDNRCVQVLAGGHRSTVAALSFSPNGKYLASSGKDRRLCLWERQLSSDETTKNQDDMFSLTAAVDSAHKRIVWGVHFCPFDSSVLVSGSRDGSVKIWKLKKSGEEENTTISEVFNFSPLTKASNGKAESVTSLAFAPSNIHGKAILALGLDTGIIELWKIPIGIMEGESPELVKCFEPELCHIATVTKLAWRPNKQSDDAGADGKMILASCSSDHGCRIFEITKH